MKKLVLLLSLSLLASCHKSPSLQGTWAVDLVATTEMAKASGLPDSIAGEIREVYDGGLLEITSDKLVMRIDGMPGEMARNYKVVSESGSCYTLEISGESGRHDYCLESDSLVVRDPNAKISVVYSGR